MNMRINFLAKLCMWSVIIVYLVLLGVFYVVYGEFGFSIFFKCSTLSISIAGIFIFLYEKFVWKWKWLNFGRFPVLHKKYEGVFTSSYDQKKRTVQMKIKQTFLKTSIMFCTGESSSTTVVASIEEINSVKYLVYLYLNQPHGDLLSDSHMHYGVNMLCIEDVDKIEGEYFTDRRTKGHMELFPVKEEK